MNKLKEIPVSLKDKEEFVKLVKIAEVSNLSPDEMSAYEASLKIARDNYSHDETIRKEKLKVVMNKLLKLQKSSKNLESR